MWENVETLQNICDKQLQKVQTPQMTTDAHSGCKNVSKLSETSDIEHQRMKTDFHKERFDKETEKEQTILECSICTAELSFGLLK